MFIPVCTLVKNLTVASIPVAASSLVIQVAWLGIAGPTRESDLISAKILSVKRLLRVGRL